MLHYMILTGGTNDGQISQFVNTSVHNQLAHKSALCVHVWMMIFYDIYSKVSYQLITKHKIPVAIYIEALRAYIRAQQNPLLDRLRFFSRIQEQGESFDEFFAAVKELQVACDFQVSTECETCRRHDDEMLRDRIVVGVSSDATRHKLLAIPQLTISDAVKIVRAEEAAATTRTNMTEKVNKVSAYKAGKHAVPQNSKTDKNSARRSCNRCGREHPKMQCLAFGKECHKCGKNGHFSNMCKAQKGGYKPTQPRAGRIRVSRIVPDEFIKVDVETNNGVVGDVRFRDDTGSDIDVIGMKQLRQIGSKLKKLAGSKHFCVLC